jgi:hypothetical protein
MFSINSHFASPTEHRLSYLELAIVYETMTQTSDLKVYTRVLQRLARHGKLPFNFFIF